MGTGRPFCEKGKKLLFEKTCIDILDLPCSRKIFHWAKCSSGRINETCTVISISISFFPVLHGGEVDRAGDLRQPREVRLRR